jgi:hypothetical protein
MDLMDDEDLKKSVIDQMMGELDNVTSDSLKKPKGESGGVAITISVKPESAAEMAEEAEEAECTDPDCENPLHDHEKKEEEPESSDYISQLIKKLG